jgi:hypothetical protein
VALVLVIALRGGVGAGNRREIRSGIADRLNPGFLVVTRELLADLLLETNDPAAALIGYEQSLRNDRNRFRSILGVARAAKQTGDVAKPREAYGKLVTLASADTDRPELAEAKAFLAN